jgi:hypothetical protein
MSDESSNFKIRCDRNQNKVYILSDVEIGVRITLYEWNSLTNETQLIYSTITEFSNNEFWYMPNRKLDTIKGLKIEIKYNDKILKEEYFNFKTIYKNDIKKPVLVLHSEVGIGDNLAATPTIKKISQIYNQKIILLTYLPFVFTNNPYIEKIIPIEKNLDQILKSFNTNEYNIYHLFNLMSTNWRLIDHKQICAYNAGLQLKNDELDMEFFPDPYKNIEKLPDNFICINPSQTEPERTWGSENWQKLINLIQQHIPVVAIGKETYLDPNLVKKFSQIEIKNGLNLINHPCQNSISQAYHIINKSKTFVTMQNGLYILALCNTENHITELATSWNSYFYRMRKNYNLEYIRGSCQVECLANPKISVDYTGDTQILKSGICYLNKKTYECHPTPEQVYESIIKYIR